MIKYRIKFPDLMTAWQRAPQSDALSTEEIQALKAAASLWGYVDGEYHGLELAKVPELLTQIAQRYGGYNDNK